MPEHLNIYQKLAKIRKPAEAIKKNRKGYGYTYVDEEEILSKITGLMTKYNVSLIPGIVPDSMTVEPYTYGKTKTTRDGTPYEEKVNEVIVKADTTWTWINNDNPEERIVVPWALVGSQSDASQAFGSALTYSSRYFLLKYFNVATSDSDPDEYRKKQKEAAEAEDRAVAEGIIDKVHEIVTKRVEDFPDDRKVIMEVIKQYAKDKGKASTNYYLIKDSETAAALLKNIQETLKIN